MIPIRQGDTNFVGAQTFANAPSIAGVKVSQNDPIIQSAPFLDFMPETLNATEGSAVSSISDIYGNTASVSNAVPIYGSSVAPKMRNSGINGWPGLYCGTNMCMATQNLFSSLSSSGFSFALVIKPLTFSAVFGVTTFSFGNLYAANIFAAQFALNTTTGSPACIELRSSIGVTADVFRMASFREQVIICVFDGTNYIIDIDGQTLSYAANAGNITLNGPMTFGNIYSDANNFTGIYGRMTGWNRALNPTERRLIGRYLYRKYVDNGNRRIWGIGTSFAQGLLADANQTQFDLLQPNFPQNRIINSCIAAPLGDIANMVSGVAPFPDLLSEMQNGIVMIDDISADLANGDSASTVYGRVTTLVQQFHAQGCLVLVTTCRPKQASTNGTVQAAFEVQRGLFNTAVTGNAAGADATYDLTVTAAYNSPTSYTDGTYYTGGPNPGGGDYTGAHPTTAAYATEITAKTSALKGLLGI